MRSKNVTIWVMAIALSLGSSPALGIHFRDGGTHDIDYLMDDSVYIDWEAPGMGTRVNLLYGAYIHGSASVYESGRLNILGGGIETWVNAYDNSHISMPAGWLYLELCAHDRSEVDIWGGWIREGMNMEAADASIITIYGSDFNYPLGPIADRAGILTGTLVGGEAIMVNFSIGEEAQIILVPEPTTLLLLGLGAVMLRKRR